MVSKLTEAVRKARNGYAVFPLAANQKIPLIAGGAGCLDATCDVGIVSAWWEATPDANIGVLCGPRPEGSGVWVLDVDGEDGKASLAALVAQHGPLPDTLVVDTPSGGQHYYFAYPRGRTIRNKVGIVGPDGQRVRHLDVRSARGYVVAPPSVVGGRPYRVVQRCPPVDAPDWLLNLVAPDEPQRPAWVPRVVPTVGVGGDALRRRRVAFCRASLETACARIAGMKEGEGRNDAVNKALLAFSGYAAAGYLDDADTLSRIEAAAAASGLPRREIAQLFRGGGGWDKGYAEPRHPELEERARQVSGHRPDVWAVEDVVPVTDTAGADLDPEEINRRLADAADPPDEPPLILDATVRHTDVGNAARLVRRFLGRIRFCPQMGWLTWDGSRWVLDERGVVREMAKSVARDLFEEAEAAQIHADEMETKYGADSDEAQAAQTHAKAVFRWAMQSENEPRQRAMLRLAESSPDVVAVRSEFDTEPELLNLRDCVVNLRNGARIEHTPTRLMLHRAEASLGGGDCPKWRAFLRAVTCGRKDLEDYLQRVIGLALLGRGPKQAFVVFHGFGANGKSTFMNVIRKIMGTYCVDTPTETFLKTNQNAIPADLARMAGARLVTMAEPDLGVQLAEGLIKRFTGEGTITARFMRENFFEFKPTALPLMLCNPKPVVRGVDNGIWRRIKLVPWDHQFPQNEQVEDYDEQMLREERDGIFQWMLAGAMIYLNAPKDPLNDPEIVRQAVAEYRSEMDLLAEFLEEYTRPEPKGSVPYTQLREAFDAWAESNGGGRDKSWSAKKFTHELAARGYVRDGRKDEGRPVLGLVLTRTPPQKVTQGLPMWRSGWRGSDDVQE